MSRILVVEPNRRIAKFIAGILVDFGHQVEQCDDVPGAQKWLSQEQFDVLATDLVMHHKADDFAAMTGYMAVLTLTGRPFYAGADGVERPMRLNDKPFRVADLHRLVSVIAATEEARSLAA